MTTKIYFLGHLGLGDHFVYAGMMLWMAANPAVQEVAIVCKTPNLPTLKHLYSDVKKITFYAVGNDNEISPNYGAPPHIIEGIRQAGYTVVAVGTHGPRAHTYLQLDPCWANTFYKEVGIDPATRFTGWRLPSAMSGAEKKWRALLSALWCQDYIIVHDDPSRDFTINYDDVRDSLRNNGQPLSQLPIVYLGKDRYKWPLIGGLNNPTHIAPLLECESLLDLVLIMRHAKAAYMMDSSLAILLDLSSPLEEQMRVSYMKYDIFPTSNGLYQSKWTYRGAKN